MRPKRHEQALAAVMADVIATPDGATYFAKKISGAWQRYDLPGDHPLIGRSAPDLEFEDGTRLGEYCREGGALLFDLTGDPHIAELGAKWQDRLRTVRLRTISLRTKEASDLAALFVRPDGCVALAINKGADPAGAEQAISTWIGPPHGPCA
jgi:hypothetical protein